MKPWNLNQEETGGGGREVARLGTKKGTEKVAEKLELGGEFGGARGRWECGRRSMRWAWVCDHVVR